MGMTDPIADMLTRIRNASRARHQKVAIPWSRVKENIIKVLIEEGYLRESKKVKASRGRGGGACDPAQVRQGKSSRDRGHQARQPAEPQGLRWRAGHDADPKRVGNQRSLDAQRDIGGSGGSEGKTSGENSSARYGSLRRGVECRVLESCP